MNRKRVLGLSGSFLLIIGIFLPAAKVPLLGNMSYFRNAPAEAVLILICAAVSILLTLRGAFLWLWGTGSVCAVTILITIYTAKTRMEKVMVQDADEVGMARLVEDALTSTVHMDIGLPVLSAGIVLICIAPGLRSAGAER